MFDESNDQGDRLRGSWSVPAINVMVLAMLVAIELTALWGFMRLKVPDYHLYQTIGPDELGMRYSSTLYGYDGRYRRSFSDRLSSYGIDGVDEFTIEEATRIREQLLGLGEARGEPTFGEPLDLLDAMSENRKLLCGELALVYGLALDVLGFEVRSMKFSRSLFDAYDTHSTIEIWDRKKEKWILSDPTFNVSFAHKGRLLSAYDLYQLVHSGKTDEIAIERGKTSRYAYVLEDYYIAYFSLLDNVSYLSHVYLPDLFRWPPLRFFDERRIVRLTTAPGRSINRGEMYVQNAVVVFIYLLNPLLILLLSGSLLRSRVRQFRGQLAKKSSLNESGS